MAKESGSNDEYEGQTGLGDIGNVLSGKGICFTYTRQKSEKILDIVNDLIENG